MSRVLGHKSRWDFEYIDSVHHNQCGGCNDQRNHFCRFFCKMLVTFLLGLVMFLWGVL